MAKINLFLIILCLFFNSMLSSSSNGRFLIAVHGGAGSYDRLEVTLEKEIKIKKGIFDSLKAGFNSLKNNNSHLEAVELAIIELENNPLYNAGKGSKINKNFQIEMDASIMDEKTLNCGAVANSKHIKNPIIGARLVMEKTPHILIAGIAVDEFAKQNSIEVVRNYYFFTLERIKEWLKAKANFQNIEKNRKGTVGAVAIDKLGNLSAATSTGGLTYKMPGRIGDSPIIGAGNYANNDSCAISCTGTGEIFMKKLIAYDLHARMTYKNISLETASKEIMATLDEDTGGFISISKNYEISMPFNSGGMARGYVKEDGIAFINIFNNDDLTPTEYNILDI